MQHASRSSWTSTESAETQRTQRRHRLRRRTQVTASDSHGRLRTGVDPVGRARLPKRTLKSDNAMAELDDEWVFVKHVEGSANHKPQGYNATWTEYWKERIGRELPTLCPGATVDGPHPLEKKGKGKYGYVGAHVLIRHKQSGREKYVIIPTCSPCNRSQKPLLLFCRAVTILSLIHI